MSLGVSFLCNFLEEFEKDVLSIWKNSPVKPSGPGLLFWGVFLMTDLIFVLVTSLSGSLFLYDSVLEDFVPRNLSIYSGCAISWCIIVYCNNF